MKLYRIRNWDELFENSRSRVVAELSWVPVPNHHDGENFTAIMAHQDGAMIFSGWILLLEIASKCIPRGTLIRGNGQPHTVTTLSAKCRAPDTWLSCALKYLEENTDWLDVVDVDGGHHLPVTQPSPARHPSAEEGREGIERREGRHGARHLPEIEVPSWEEVRTECAKIGLVEWKAHDWFNKMETIGWIDDKKREITKWRAYLLTVKSWWERDGRPMSPPRGGNAAKPEKHPNIL